MSLRFVSIVASPIIVASVLPPDATSRRHGHYALPRNRRPQRGNPTLRGNFSQVDTYIGKSQCVIADFTGNRGGVYFEAGFALGLDIPVIWLVDDHWWNETDEHGKRINDIHFDTRQ